MIKNIMFILAHDPAGYGDIALTVFSYAAAGVVGTFSLLLSFSKSLRIPALTMAYIATAIPILLVIRSLMNTDWSNDWIEIAVKSMILAMPGLLGLALIRYHHQKKTKT